MNTITKPGRGCPECAWGKVAGCWRCGSGASACSEFLTPNDKPASRMGVVKSWERWAMRNPSTAVYLFMTCFGLGMCAVVHLVFALVGRR